MIFFIVSILTVSLAFSSVPAVYASHYCDHQWVESGAIFNTNNVQFNKQSYTISDSPNISGKVNDCNIDKVKIVIKDSCGKIVTSTTSSVPRNQGDYQDSFWVQVKANDWYYSGTYSATVSSNGKQISSTNMSFSGNGPHISSTSDPNCSKPKPLASDVKAPTGVFLPEKGVISFSGKSKVGDISFSSSGKFGFELSSGNIKNGKGSAKVKVSGPVSATKTGYGQSCSLSGTFDTTFSVKGKINNGKLTFKPYNVSPISFPAKIKCSSTTFTDGSNSQFVFNPLSFSKSIPISYSQGASKTTSMSFNSGSSTWKAIVDKVGKTGSASNSIKMKTLTEEQKKSINDFKNTKEEKKLTLKPIISDISLRITDPKNKISYIKQGESKDTSGTISTVGNISSVKLKATQWIQNDVKTSFISNHIDVPKYIKSVSFFNAKIKTSCNTEPGKYLITISGSPTNSFKQSQDTVTVVVQSNPNCSNNTKEQSTQNESIIKKDRSYSNPYTLKENFDKVTLGGINPNDDFSEGIEFTNGVSIQTGTKLVILEDNENNFVEVSPYTKIEKKEKGVIDLLWGKIKVHSKLLHMCSNLTGTPKSGQISYSLDEGLKCTFSTKIITVGIQGTEFILEHDPDQKITTVHLHEGSVKITKNIKGAETITLEAGNSAVTKSGYVHQITKMTESQWESMNEPLVNTSGSFYVKTNKNTYPIFNDPVIITGNVGTSDAYGSTSVEIDVIKEGWFETVRCSHSVTPKSDGSFIATCYDSSFGAARGNFIITAKWGDQQVTTNIKRVDMPEKNSFEPTIPQQKQPITPFFTTFDKSTYHSGEKIILKGNIGSYDVEELFFYLYDPNMNVIGAETGTVQNDGTFRIIITGDSNWQLDGNYEVELISGSDILDTLSFAYTSSSKNIQQKDTTKQSTSKDEPTSKEEIPKLDVDLANEYYFEAFESLNQENYEEALEYFSKALELLPDDENIRSWKADTLNEIGINHFNEENYEEALEYFSKALEVEPNNESIQSNKEDTLSHLPSFEKSIEKVPSWIKNNAKWWTQGTIGDSEFIGGLQHLIKENIISIPHQDTVESKSSNSIPDWVKTQTEWWANGKISEDEFLNSVQYMIKQGMIKISTEQQKSSENIDDEIKSQSILDKNIDDLIFQVEERYMAGDYEQSNKIAKEIISIDRENYIGNFYYAASFLELEDYWAANEIFQYVGLDYFPDDCRFLEGTARSLYYLDDDEAVQYADKALQVCPEDFDKSDLLIIKK